MRLGPSRATWRRVRKAHGPTKVANDLPSCRNFEVRASVAGAAKTLEVAQELYDGQGKKKKIITYPRRGSPLLPKSFDQDVPRIVPAYAWEKSSAQFRFRSPRHRKGASGGVSTKGVGQGASITRSFPNVNTVKRPEKICRAFERREEEAVRRHCAGYMPAVMPDCRYRQTTQH